MTSALAADDGTQSKRDVAYKRVEAALALPMLILALLIIPVLLIPLAWPGLPHEGQVAFNALDLFIWAAFTVEYLLLLGLASDRWRHFRSHLFDLVLVGLPMLRPLRILRTARLLRIGSFARAGAAAGVAAGISRRRMASTAALYAPLAAGVLVLACSVFVYNAEHGAKDANIKSLPDALWWATTTITTVGYGDRYPVTATGKALAVVLMLVGIALLGVITAGIAAAFVRWSATPAEHRATREHDVESHALTQVLDELRALRLEVAELRTSSNGLRNPT